MCAHQTSQADAVLTYADTVALSFQILNLFWNFRRNISQHDNVGVWEENFVHKLIILWLTLSRILQFYELDFIYIRLLFIEYCKILKI